MEYNLGNTHKRCLFKGKRQFFLRSERILFPFLTFIFWEERNVQTFMDPLPACRGPLGHLVWRQERKHIY